MPRSRDVWRWVAWYFHTHVQPLATLHLINQPRTERSLSLVRESYGTDKYDLTGHPTVRLPLILEVEAFSRESHHRTSNGMSGEASCRL
jgi:hypothetical protein